MPHQWKQRRQTEVGKRNPETRVMEYKITQFDCVLEIDLEAVMKHLLRKAAHSKSGVSKMQGGMIKLTAKRVA